MAKAAAVIIIAAVLSSLIKKQSPVFALVLTIGTGAVVLTGFVPQLESITALLKEITGAAGSNTYMGIMLKITGIAYLSGFAADICLDAGEKALADKAVTAGKILIAFYGLPIVAELIRQVNFMFSG